MSAKFWPRTHQVLLPRSLTSGSSRVKSKYWGVAQGSLPLAGAGVMRERRSLFPWDMSVLLDRRSVWVPVTAGPVAGRSPAEPPAVSGSCDAALLRRRCSAAARRLPLAPLLRAPASGTRRPPRAAGFLLFFLRMTLAVVAWSGWTMFVS